MRWPVYTSGPAGHGAPAAGRARFRPLLPGPPPVLCSAGSTWSCAGPAPSARLRPTLRRPARPLRLRPRRLAHQAPPLSTTSRPGPAPPPAPAWIGQPGPTSHGEPGPVPGGRCRSRQAPGTGGVCRMPIERLREGHFHLCHRHRFDLGPADVHSEEVQVPLSVECSGGRGCRLSGQLLGDPRGDTEVQQPLALSGDGKAPHRHGHRSAHLGELQPGHTRPGPGEF